MNFKDFFKKFGLERISLSCSFASAEFTINNEDETAAWEMYVELITRVATQKLPENFGDEVSALDSIYSIFQVTRDILKSHGRLAKSFTKISIIILNQIIRPFTAKWHKQKNEGLLDTEDGKKMFRNDLLLIQDEIYSYCKMLSEIAKVEDLIYLKEETNNV